MLTDRFGYELSTGSGDARDAYVAGCDGVLSAEHGDIATLERATRHDPKFALAHMALARARFIVGDALSARKALAQAKEHVAGATEREQSHVATMALAIEGKPVECFDATRAHLARWPCDAMVASPATGVFGLIGFSGRIGREPEQVAFLEALRPHLGTDWWFRMVWAFALLECGRAAEALEEMEASLALRPTNAHGAHIKVHALYELGRMGPALGYLQEWMPTYPKQGMMHCHISWHVALCLLAENRADEAWQVYRAQVHPGGAWGPALNIATDGPAPARDRELAGGTRDPAAWREIDAYAAKSFPRAGIAFVDVHNALAALVAGNDGRFAQLVDEIDARTASGKAPTGDTVPRLVAGLRAYAEGRFADCARTLEEARADTVRIGGSRAQRDLLEQTLLAALVKSGRTDQARRLLAGITDRVPVVRVAGLA